MRRLPTNKTEKQKLIIRATKDYFGETNPEEKKSALKISLWLMGRKKRNSLTEEEREVMETIRTNLRDKDYVTELNLKPCSGTHSEALKPCLAPIS